MTWRWMIKQRNVPSFHHEWIPEKLKRESNNCFVVFDGTWVKKREYTYELVTFQIDKQRR